MSAHPMISVIAKEMDRLGYGLHESHAQSIWLKIQAEQHQGEPVGEVTANEAGFWGRLYYMPVTDGTVNVGDKLYTHADPGEVERLRADIARLDKENLDISLERKSALEGWDKSMDECDTLRAQLAALEALHGGELGLPKEGWPEYHKRKMESLRDLTVGRYERKLAERDALLRDVQTAMREYEQGCDQFPPFHHNQLMERIEAALSASAEPSAPVEHDEFCEGQWWLAELDYLVESGTADQRRAVAVVRNMMRQLAVARAALERQP